MSNVITNSIFLFLDMVTDNMLADAHVTGDRLPDSFEGDVILPLREAHWKVLEADPLHAEDFIRAGKLLLIMQKIDSERLPEEI